MLSDEELDEHDARVYVAADVNFQADMMAHRLAYGLVGLDEAWQFLADTDTSANVYIDLSYLEGTIFLMETQAHLASQGMVAPQQRLEGR